MKESSYTNKYYILTILGISILFGFSVLRNIKKEYNIVEKIAKNEGLAYLNNDFHYQDWLARQGDVYVAISENISPNSYLDSSSYCDSLILLNPAYITRLEYELVNNQNRNLPHVTSLNPIRKENKPDDWETNALLLFENGEEEYSEIIKTDTADYLRFMRPLYVSKLCLECHASQGYKVGQQMGGISTYVSMDKYNRLAVDNIKSTVVIHLVIYILFIILVIYSYLLLKKEVLRQNTIQLQFHENETKLKKQNSEVELRNKELLLAKQHAEEGEHVKMSFFANMSHEIRTPMNGIIGFSEMLNQKGLLEEKRIYYSGIIKESGQRLLAIVDDIIDISKIETNQIKITEEEIDLRSMLKELYEIHIEHFKRKNIELRLDSKITKSKSNVIVDGKKLKQIINNLLTNALKFTEKGEISFGACIKDSKLEFFVQDSGIGISENMKAKIFDRFRQADDSVSRLHGGTGLGLSISKGFLDLMGGDIYVESSIGKGSKFIFQLPYKSGKIILNRKNIPFSIKKQSLKGFSILIAEDDETNFMFLSEALSIYGPTLILAENGVEAVEAVVKRPSINLVLMDLKMPIMNGYEATKQIKRLNSKIPIVAQTAFAYEEDRKKVLDFGFDDYISKPIKIEALLKIIDHFS